MLFKRRGLHEVIFFDSLIRVKEFINARIIHDPIVEKATYP